MGQQGSSHALQAAWLCSAPCCHGQTSGQLSFFPKGFPGLCPHHLPQSPCSCLPCLLQRRGVIAHTSLSASSLLLAK